jgi:hypothetical protein
MSSYMSDVPLTLRRRKREKERESGAMRKWTARLLLIDTFMWGMEGGRASLDKRFPGFTRSSFW